MFEDDQNRALSLDYIIFLSLQVSNNHRPSTLFDLHEAVQDDFFE